MPLLTSNVMFKTGKNNEIIFSPPRWVSKKCRIIPSEKLKSKIEWFNRLNFLLLLCIFTISGILNSWAIFIASLAIPSIIQHFYLKKLIAPLQETEERITVKDTLNEIAIKTSYFWLWLFELLFLMTIFNMIKALIIKQAVTISALLDITLFIALSVFVLYLFRLKKHNKSVKQTG